MTKSARRWLVALVEDRICHTCKQDIVSREMLPWSGECVRCRLIRLDKEPYP
jgi:hypothetical protein